jgi:two-component system invasion response regulator UvrY
VSAFLDMKASRVLVADDHAVVRQGIRQILADSPEFDIVREAATGAEVLEHLRDGRIDILVLDISMPGMSGLEVIKQVHREYPKVAVLVLSVHPESQYALRVMKSGASGYLTKTSAPEEMVAALKRIASGHKYVGESLGELLANDLEHAVEGPRHAILSDREYEVLCLIAAGFSVQQIADQLVLSVKTVSTYRARLLQKMGMKTGAELTRYALTQGLVD